MMRVFTPNNGLLRHILNVLFGVLLFFGAAYVSFSMFSKSALPERPRVIQDIWIEPTTILPGRSFKVHLKVHINESCPAEVHWALVRVSDNVEVLAARIPAVPTKLGDNELTNARTVAPSVAPGEYYYTSTIYDFCGPERITFIASTKHVPISVR